MVLFIKVLQGEHLSDSRVDYIRMEKALIECKNSSKNFATDVDGEVGPDFPLEIELIQQVLQVYLPKVSDVQTRDFSKFHEEISNIIAQI